MDEETKPKRAAKDNPWYRLATFHGEPASYDDETTAAKNRVTWNRWMASRIPDALRAALLEKGHTQEELTPFPEDELRTIGSQLGISAEAEIDFENTEFDTLYANRFVFPDNISFAEANFSCYADFRGATFSGDAHFSSVKFSRNTVFSSAEVSGVAFFDSAKFSYANFGSAEFSGGAFFDSATFSGEAYFNSVTFSDYADFTGAKFSGVGRFRSVECSNVYFDRATFSSYADFSSTTFNGDAVFTNADMKAETFFNDVNFAAPPQCFNAKLHEGTTWHGVQWPEVPQDIQKARKFIDAYERLKLEMDKLKKHGNELDFFALEQQCRRVADGFWKGLPIAIYGFVSDYGRSYVRPLGLLVATVLVGTIIFAAHEAGFWTPLLGYVSKAAGISFANTLSLLGKPLLNPDVMLYKYSDWLKAVATIQTILGIAFLFLFGLGIRNRFRMK